MEPANVNQPACRHAALFANSGQFAYESMMEAQKKIGLEPCFLTKARAIAILNLLPEKQTPQALCRVINTARSGVWNADGSFNEEVFSELTRLHSIRDRGVHVMTYKMFRAFLDEKHGSGYSGVMTSAYLIPITYHQVTDGSVRELFNVFSDCVYQGENAISIPTLRRFYTDPEPLWQEIVDEVSLKYSLTVDSY